MIIYDMINFRGVSDGSIFANKVRMSRKEFYVACW